MRVQNLHTHTHYCDGKDAPEVMVRRAIELGFSSLGFSGHISMPMETVYAMSMEKTAAYIEEIRQLKQKYRDVLDIYLGIENDLYSEASTKEYDYVIGSVHYVKKNGVLRDVDSSLAFTKATIDEFYGGDAFAYAKAYYEGVMSLCETKKFDFVGHFDLLNKFCDSEDLFDIGSEKYQKLALEALHTVKERCDIFEVNTGAISRGYRKTPYPEPFLLREMKKIGAYVILTSDCHDARYLNCGFEDAYDLIRSCGFKCLLYRTSKGWEEEAL